MSTIAEMLDAAPETTLTPELTKALGAAKLYDVAHAMLQYHCSTCTGGFDEATVEAVLKRAAANTHGEAITPELEAAVRIMRIRDDALAELVYACSTCKGSFDEETVQAVLKRAAANTHGEAITPQIEAAVAVAAR
jgi:DNA-directed RNA polymerase subunit RPC12/RpoP